MTRSGGSVVLDTSAYVHFRRGAAEVVERLARSERVVVPVTVVGELEAGFAGGTKRRANQRSLSAFLEEPFVAVAEISVEVAEVYGELFAALKLAGTPIPTNDVWIAAVAVVAGAPLLTFDSDFERVPGLRLAGR